MMPRVAVTGGSVGGLTAALVLRDAGCDVTVFERSSAALQARGAGIATLEATLRYLTERGGRPVADVCSATNWIRFLRADGSVRHEQRHRYLFSSWNTIYRSLLGLFDLQATQGPALECYRSGIPQAADHLLAAISWPALGLSIAAHGYRTMDAMPMRLRSHVIGVLSLLGGSDSGLDDADLVVAQALADVATISVLQYRALQDGRILAAQLKQALTSRVVIEQAKGVLSERWRTTMDDAFGRLRRYARAHNEHLSEVARRVTTGELAPDQLVGPPPASQPVRRTPSPR